jgi:hypothetical protein
VLEEYLQELSDEGELDSAGAITLDPGKAREKLASNRFLHAAEGILAVVGAALLAQSHQVRILREGQRITVLSTGALAAEDLRSLFTAMFSDHQPAPAKELALALNSLFPKHCTEVRVELVQPDSTLLCGYFLQAEWVVSQQPITHSWPGEFSQSVVIQRPSPWHRPLQWLLDRVRGLAIDDLHILRSRTRWCPVPVQFAKGASYASSRELLPVAFPGGAWAYLNAQSYNPVLQLPPYPDIPPGLYRWEISSRARSSLQGALLRSDGDDSTVTIVYRGLTMARHRFKSRLLPFEGVINTEVLDLDASRQQIVNNSRLWNLTGQMRTWIAQAVSAWIGQLDNQTLTTQDRRRLMDLLVGLTTAKKDAVIFEGLRDLDILPIDGRGYVSVRQLESLVEQFSGLHTAPQETKNAVWLHGRPVVNEYRQPWSNLRKRFRWAKVDASPALNYLRRGSRAPVPPDPLLQFGPLQGSDWKASLSLPSRFKDETFIQLRWGGEPFELVTDPCFTGVQQSYVIDLDGHYSDSFRDADRRLIRELRAVLWERCEELLVELCRQCYLKQEIPEAQLPYPGLEDVCSWVYVYLSTHKGSRRKAESLPAEVRAYPLFLEGRAVYLGQLLNHRGDWSELIPNVEHTPLQWIRHRC